MNKLDHISKNVKQALDDLQARHPETGFIVIGLSDVGDATEVSMAYGVDDECLTSTLNAIAQDKGAELLTIPSKKKLH